MTQGNTSVALEASAFVRNAKIVLLPIEVIPVFHSL